MVKQLSIEARHLYGIISFGFHSFPGCAAYKKNLVMAKALIKET